MKKISYCITILLLIGSLIIPAFADDDHHGDDHDEDHVCFKRVDRNADDKVTPEELVRLFPEDKTLFKI